MLIPWLEIGVIIAAAGGFSIALYIRCKKNAPKPMICPMRSNCTNVITSRYSRFLGMHVELLGLFYYVLTVLIHIGLLAFLFLDYTVPAGFIVLLIGFALSAVIFSLYLVLVQAVALKEWCTWCLISATICLIIVCLVVAQYHFGLGHGWSEIIHLFSEPGKIGV